MAGVLQERVDAIIEVATRAMIRGHDQRVVGILSERLRDRPEPLVPRPEFVHAPLLPELVNRGADLATGEVFNGLLQRGVLLPHDGVETNRLDAGVLQLVIRSARLDGMMLARVSDEQDAIVRTEPVQEVVHLPRAREARFVDHIEPRGAIPGVGRLDKMTLHGLRRDAGVGESVRRAGRGGEPFHAVAVPLGRSTDRSQRRRFAGPRDAFQGDDAV
ncbi:MAG TPA: hypothetical protein VEL79_18335, partial [Vicinamibacterales bacterium]|nr:hypothetical protein [Vicinamibacterales bacterium]